MRIVYLASTSAMGPASRYRIYQFRRFFADAGIQLDILPALEDDWLKAEYHVGTRRRLARLQAGAAGALRRAKQLTFLGQADLVIVERELFPKLPAFLENQLLKKHGGYGIEFDDAIFLSPGRTDKYPDLVRNAAFVLAGNDYLKDWASQYQANIEVVPTCVDPKTYRAKSNYTLKAQPEIGWVGLSSNLPYVSSIAPHLSAAIKNHNAKLHVLSGHPGDIELPLIFSAWSSANETQIIEQFDIGIMPLPDNEFAQGKCGLKILQYMAAGVPVIASAVGVNQTIIEDGVNGLLVQNAAQWHDALESLLTDQQLRESLGRAGRDTVEKSYSTDIWGPKLVAIYRKFASST